MLDNVKIRNPFTFGPEDVVAEPYPHVIKQDFIDPDLFQRLKREYPSDEMFDRSSSAGARAGRDLYRGDAEYDSFLASSSAWSEFHNFMNSQQFVDFIMSLYGDYLGRFECYTDPKLAKFVDYVEPREELHDKSRIGQKFDEIVMRMSTPKNVNDLAVRMDLGQAGVGYHKAIHCDRPNRLITMVVYFCDADERDAVGGDLGIHEFINKESKKSYSEYPRHPRPGETKEVARLRPKENLGVVFPCSNHSYHSVTPIESQNGYRNFIYCSVFGTGKTIWKEAG